MKEQCLVFQYINWHRAIKVLFLLLLLDSLLLCTLGKFGACYTAYSCLKFVTEFRKCSFCFVLLVISITTDEIFVIQKYIENLFPFLKKINNHICVGYFL